AFLAEFKGAYASLFPQVQGNPDVVAVVNQRHLARVEGLVEDAIAAGVRVESFPENLPADAVAANAADRRRPLRVVVDPPAGCRIQQEEIFGPAMVLLPYDTIDAVLADISSRPRPLALYWFGTDEGEKQMVLERSLS